VLLTGAELLMTREAVAMETPASLATSARVGAALGFAATGRVMDIRHPSGTEDHAWERFHRSV
jgi:hypothetical protein